MQHKTSTPTPARGPGRPLSSTMDFSRFCWRENLDVPGRHFREACGAEYIEAVWNFYNRGEQNLFLGVYATLESMPSSSSDLLSKARLAWKSLRWEVPTIAASTFHEDHADRLVTAYIVYDNAKSSADVDAWANETVISVEGCRDLDALRYDVQEGPLPAQDYGHQSFMYVVPWSSTKVGFLFRTSHITFDGAGIKVAMSKFLIHLAGHLGDPSYGSKQEQLFRWGTEHTNILPPITEILRKYEPEVRDADGQVISPELPEEKREGLEYAESLNNVLNGFSVMANALAFKSIKHPMFDVKKEKPKSRRLFHTFSVEDSAGLKAAGAAKSSTDVKLTVNHIVHGALMILPVLDNDPEPGSAAVISCFGDVDSRQRLLPPFRTPLGYPGYCLSVSGITVPVSVIQEAGPDDRAKVLASARVIQKEYKGQTEIPHFLGIITEETLIVCSPSLPPACGPSYAADGPGSKYLQPEYLGDDGKKIIIVDDFMLSLNKTEPGPHFRAYEWGGKITLSVDFNENAVEITVVQRWVDKWVELIRSVF